MLMAKKTSTMKTFALLLDKRWSLLTILFLILNHSSGQNTFQKTYDLYLNAIGPDRMTIQQSSDGSFITSTYANKDSCCFIPTYSTLFKTDKFGNQIWYKSYTDTGSSFNACYFSQNTDDGGTIVVGNTQADWQVLLFKTNTDGNLEWAKSYGGSSYDYGFSVQQTSDGGFILAGRTESYGTGGDLYLIKTDDLGAITWSRTYGGSAFESGESVLETSDGGFIVVGNWAQGTASQNIYIIRTNSSGTLLWSKVIGGSGKETPRAIKRTADNGFIVVGNTYSFGAGTPSYPNSFLLKLDSMGNLNWSRTLETSFYNEGHNVHQTEDLGYLMTGSISDGGLPHYALKMDQNGDIVWAETYGLATVGPLGMNAAETQDDGLIIASLYPIDVGDEPFLYLMKIDSSGTGSCNQQSFVPVWNDTLYPISTPATVVDSTFTSIESSIVLIEASATLVDSSFCFSCPNLESSFSYTASTVCENETVEFTNVSTGAESMEWFEDGVPFSTSDSSVSRTFTSAGNYEIMLAASNTACNDTMTTSIVVNALPTPDLGEDTVLCPEDIIVLDGGSGFSSYLWSDSSTAQTLSVSTSGTYFVTVTDNNNCSATDTISIESIPCNTGLKESSQNAIRFEVYPNPYKNETQISYTLVKNSIVKLQVYNILGEVIHVVVNESQLPGKYQYTFSAQRSGYPPGVYFLELSLDDFTHEKKVIEF